MNKLIKNVSENLKNYYKPAVDGTSLCIAKDAFPNVSRKNFSAAFTMVQNYNKLDVIIENYAIVPAV